ncbi:GIN domain-containing protein [Neolewinella antarctica]|uniref:Putative auto-transporter adhesin head GIN domain-containing protein n=1 Tax=Neolewinella antarctica TaxID=442734 RepID=A0ABX0XDF6_9BACT|nr:DUF2807 domain-containing protein [Neolewinella antarctica]NJC27110.1 hypothetical protein [Neolewinella antarctica]
MLRTSFLLLLLTCFTLTTCAQRQRSVKASNNTVTEMRDHADFTGLDVSSTIEATVRQGSAYSVEIEASDNVIGLVETSVRSGVLQLTLAQETRYEDLKVRAVITMPTLTSLRASGAARVAASGFTEGSGEMDFDFSGAASVSVKDSRAKRLNLDASGASNVDLADLKVERAEIDVAGASSIKLGVSEQLSGKASGASSVRNRGSASLNVRTSGASRIQSVD